MQTSLLVIIAIAGVWVIAAIVLWMIARSHLSRIQSEEMRVIRVYWQKTYKIPALIEILKAYDIQEKAFETIISLHEKSLGIEAQSMYDILENNKRIQKEFQLLMTLANTIPEIQKVTAFVAIREHIISLERTLRGEVIHINKTITLYMRWRRRKNWSILGILLPAERAYQFGI